MGKVTNAILTEGDSSAMTGHRRITLSNSHISAMSDVGEGKIKWIGISKIEKTAEYGYIYLSTIDAVIVPKRAFPNEEGFNAFMQEAMNFAASANTESPQGSADQSPSTPPGPVPAEQDSN